MSRQRTSPLRHEQSSSWLLESVDRAQDQARERRCRRELRRLGTALAVTGPSRTGRGFLAWHISHRAGAPCRLESAHLDVLSSRVKGTAVGVLARGGQGEWGEAKHGLGRLTPTRSLLLPLRPATPFCKHALLSPHTR